MTMADDTLRAKDCNLLCDHGSLCLDPKYSVNVLLKREAAVGIESADDGPSYAANHRRSVGYEN